MINKRIRKYIKSIKQFTRRNFSDGGFTLMELSTTIMIISILLLIAFPVFITVATNSELKTCKSTLRILDGGITHYLADTGKEPTGMNDIVPTYVKSIPIEPTGGTYTFVAATSTTPAHVECSKGH